MSLEEQLTEKEMKITSIVKRVNTVGDISAGIVIGYVFQQDYFNTLQHASSELPKLFRTLHDIVGYTIIYTALSTGLDMYRFTKDPFRQDININPLRQGLLIFLGQCAGYGLGYLKDFYYHNSL